jgi:GTP-binding protein Era
LVAVVTKTELVSRDQLAVKLQEVSQMRDWAAIVPVSAVAGRQLDDLLGVIFSLLPESSALYPEDAVTDESIESRICELIRESALEGVHDELPHSIAVTIDEMSEREDGSMVDIHANVWVERDSQKGIIIGKGGSRLREVGAVSRKEIEVLIGKKVFLGLRVKVAKEWQRDPKQLGKLGF